MKKEKLELKIKKIKEEKKKEKLEQKIKKIKEEKRRLELDKRREVEFERIKQREEVGRIVHEQSETLKIFDREKQSLRMLTEEWENNISKKIMEKFDKVLEELLEKQKLFRCEFKKITSNEVNGQMIDTMNLLGKKGWKFCFVLGENFYFQRERIFKKIEEKENV